MEVISIYRLKKLNFSLDEIGVPMPMDSELVEDLIYLENMINEKQRKDQERNMNKVK